MEHCFYVGFGIGFYIGFVYTPPPPPPPPIPQRSGKKYTGAPVYLKTLTIPKYGATNVLWFFDFWDFVYTVFMDF